MNAEGKHETRTRKKTRDQRLRKKPLIMAAKGAEINRPFL
jgi:hypothetical protein